MYCTIRETIGETVSCLCADNQTSVRECECEGTHQQILYRNRMLCKLNPILLKFNCGKRCVCVCADAFHHNRIFQLQELPEHIVMNRLAFILILLISASQTVHGFLNSNLVKLAASKLTTSAVENAAESIYTTLIAYLLSPPPPPLLGAFAGVIILYLIIQTGDTAEDEYVRKMTELCTGSHLTHSQLILCELFVCGQSKVPSQICESVIEKSPSSALTIRSWFRL
eukprot:c8444_g1_i1.p1 GENE.c8444_g1_i1~~c8444_g1_i1.p1  ORF type:complete len:226 (-),score=41.92 c8444_g1_i1:48-725(-)